MCIKIEQAGDLQSNLDIMRLIILNHINTLKACMLDCNKASMKWLLTMIYYEMK